MESKKASSQRIDALQCNLFLAQKNKGVTKNLDELIHNDLKGIMLHIGTNNKLKILRKIFAMTLHL